MSGRITSFTHDGLVFEVRDTGPLEGPVVLLLHGFPQRASSWDAVAQRLNAAGLRTVAPDQRGYSPGARPRGRSPYRLSRLVGDVAALVEVIGGPVHLVGHDWGAAVAWATAAARPELLHSLTAVSVPHPRAMLRALPHGQAKASWYMAFFQLPWIPERALRRLHPAPEALAAAGITAEMFGRFREEIVGDGALRGGLAWYRALPFGWDPQLTGRVRVPTTHVWSDGDDALIRLGAELTGEYVDADYELHVLTGLGHFIPEQAPDLLAELVCARVSAVRP
jgi:pimeloyl-ACP methyl ester carboxylesterase